MRHSLSSSSLPLGSSLPEPPPSLPPAAEAPPISASPPTLRRGRGTDLVLLDWDILNLLITHGAVSRSDSVSSNSLELLADVLALREELFWPELKQILCSALPYVEVSVIYLMEVDSASETCLKDYMYL